MSCAAYSQNSRDSVTLMPNKDLRAALKIINNLRTDSIMKDRDLRTLSYAIMARYEQIGLLTGRIDTYNALCGNYDSQIANLNRQITITENLNKGLHREVRREKTKTVIAWITGAAVSLFTLYVTTK